jgi:hypothetical protein
MGNVSFNEKKQWGVSQLMFIQVRNSKYFVTALYTDAKGGFNADIEMQDGKFFTLNFSKITEKFYKNGENAKLPQFLCLEVLNMAISKGIVFLSDIQKENIKWGLKK